MLLAMKNISKYFGPVAALQDVSLSVDAGEIHGLLGENGAGKSTMMNILAGTCPPSGGEIYWNDVKVSGLTACKTRAMGIRFIHQELNLVNDLTVCENLFLGEELTGRFGLLDKKEMAVRAREVLRQMELDIDVETEVGQMETSRRQLVEIAKALLFDAKLIIMDEPTTALTNREIEMLFSIMRKLKERGVSMCYISHKMPELFAVCDRYTVLRDGRLIESGFFRDIDEERATELLVGRKLCDSKLEKVQPSDEVLMKVTRLSARGKFYDVSFDLHRGEVLAITGLHGDGRDYLAEALYGVCKLDGGDVLVRGEKLSFKSITDTMRHGISMVQRNRKERSIIPDLSIVDNYSISSLAKRRGEPFVNAGEEERRFDARKDELSIKIGSSHDYITSLSGGNQQKVIIGRCLELATDVIILDNPTQGIDVGAKFEVYRIICELAAKGKGIVIFSSEYQEINRVADRCLVMYRGRINSELARSEFSEVNIMKYATGANINMEVSHDAKR